MASRSFALGLPYDAWEPIVEALKDGDKPQDTRAFTRDVGSLSGTCTILRQYLGPFLYKDILLRGPRGKDSWEPERTDRWRLASVDYTLRQLQDHANLCSMVTRFMLEDWALHVQFIPDEEPSHAERFSTVINLLPTLHNLTSLGLILVAITVECHDVLRQLSKIHELNIDRCSLWPCTEPADARPSLLAVYELRFQGISVAVTQGASSFANGSHLRKLETDSIPLLCSIYQWAKRGRQTLNIIELILPNDMDLRDLPPGIDGPGDVSNLLVDLLALCPMLRRLALPRWMTFSMHGLCPDLRHLTASVPLATTAMSWRHLTTVYAVDARNAVPAGAYAALTALVSAAREHAPTAITNFVYVCSRGASFSTVVDICVPLLGRLRKFGISNFQMPDTVGDVCRTVIRHRAELARMQEMHFSYLMPDVEQDDMDALISLCLDLQPACPELCKVSIGETTDCVLSDGGEWAIV